MPRGKNYNKPIVNSCSVPKFTITIDSESNLLLCACDGWLPIPVGKVQDFDTIEEVFSSPVAQMLQNDIDQKKFTWCAVEHCGILYANRLQNMYNLNINIDNSCNLACPSCRRDLYMLTSGSVYEQKVLDISRILAWLEKFDAPIKISLGGSGDALASFILRNLIKNYQFKSNHKFHITTNGLLLKKVMDKSKIKDAVLSYSVSVDAGTAETYENVRRPGKWNVLLENLSWLADNRAQSRVELNFVVQRNNYRDLSAFVELCNKYNFFANIQPLNDWGTWNSTPVINPDTWTIQNGTYLDHDVINVQHPEHQEFIQHLNNIRKQNLKFVQISSYFNKFS